MIKSKSPLKIIGLEALLIQRLESSIIQSVGLHPPKKKEKRKEKEHHKTTKKGNTRALLEKHAR